MIMCLGYEIKKSRFLQDSLWGFVKVTEAQPPDLHKGKDSQPNWEGL